MHAHEVLQILADGDGWQVIDYDHVARVLEDEDLIQTSIPNGPRCFARITLRGRKRLAKEPKLRFDIVPAAMRPDTRTLIAEAVLRWKHERARTKAWYREHQLESEIEA